MESYAKKKINHTINVLKQFDPDKHPEFFDEILYGRYLARQSDFPELAKFLTVAQIKLANCVLPLNKSISGKSKLEILLKNLIDTIGALSAFDKTIRNEADYEVDYGNNFPEAQIQHVIQVLQYRPSYWEEPGPQDRFNGLPLTRRPMFAVKRVHTPGYVINSPKIHSDAAESLPQHLILSNGTYRLHVSQANSPEKGQDPQGHQQGTTQAEQAGRKHYTVFVGSTFEDMKDIRAAVLRRLNSSEEYKAIGMEDFPAADGRQLPYIKERLKGTDIYVLILGGRYGSLIPKIRPGEEDKSYTQKEYEMAMADPDIRVLAFLCSNPGDLPEKKRWKDDKEHELLTKFRDKVKDDHTFMPWGAQDSPEKIAGDVYQSLAQMDKSALRGWVRGTSGSSAK